MWQENILKSISIVIVWVGLWGLAEILVDYLAKDNIRLRIIIYIIFVILGIIILYLLEIYT